MWHAAVPTGASRLQTCSPALDALPVTERLPVRALQLLAPGTGGQPCADFGLLESTTLDATAGEVKPDWSIVDQAQLGGVLRRFTCRADSTGLQFDCDDTLRVRVALDGARVELLRGDPLSPLACEALFGAGLVLACAARERFALHASAVALGGRACLFVGDSGRGKSTLAERIGRLPGWQRLTDDITPLRVSADGIDVLPHFPQLKLASCWPAPEIPVALSLAQIFFLHRTAVGAPVATPLPSAERVPALIRHSAATRLFPPQWLQRHLRAMTDVATRVRLARLEVPEAGDDLDALALAVAQCIGKTLA